MTEIMRPMIQGKIHRARVTGADLNYVGSITIDPDLMDAANIVDGQQVDVSDINNGSRLTTYVISGERGSGEIQLNGSAARLVGLGDLVIIMAYAMVPESMVRTHRPNVVFVDEDNRISETSTDAGTVDESDPRAQELGLHSSRPQPLPEPLSESRPADQPVDQPADHLTDQLADRLTDHLTDHLTDQLADRDPEAQARLLD